MPVVTTEQVRDHLSRPPWSDSQRAACEQLIASRQARLEDWFRVPIDPVERTETVPIYAESGLIATTYPIHTLLEVDGVAAVDGMPPAPYELRDRVWLYDPTYDTGTWATTSRPFSLTAPMFGRPRVAVHYLAGWGATSDIVGAIIDKVAAVMLNRHDDTVVARNLDAEKPTEIKEDWTDAELAMLRARRRLVGCRP